MYWFSDNIETLLVLGVSGSSAGFTSFVMGENENVVPAFFNGELALLFKPAPIGLQ